VDWKTACKGFVTDLGGGGEDILLCEAAEAIDTLGVRLSFRMAASAAPVLNCMDDWRRAPPLPVIEKEGRGEGLQRSPKAGSVVVLFPSREGCGSQLVSFFRNGEGGRNGEEGRNLGEEGILVKRSEEGSSAEVDSS
jgi:hypothetical protein